MKTVPAMNFPPHDFEELTVIMQQMNLGELDLRVGKKSYHALKKMVEKPQMVATSTIVELSSLVTISPASLTRLAKLLGFHGFHEFRQVFKQSSKQSIDFYSRQAQRIKTNFDSSAKSIIAQQLNSLHQNIDQALQELEESEIEKIVKLLASKRRVFVFGHQQSASIASLFTYGLCLIRDNVQILGPVDYGIATITGQLQRRDLLVLFGSSPYSATTMEIASIAKQQECVVCSFTDSKLSPLLGYSQHSINIPTEGDYFINSLSATNVFVEGILSMVLMELKEKSVNKLKRHEQLLQQFNKKN